MGRGEPGKCYCRKNKQSFILTNKRCARFSPTLSTSSKYLLANVTITKNLIRYPLLRLYMQPKVSKMVSLSKSVEFTSLKYYNFKLRFILKTMKITQRPCVLSAELSVHEFRLFFYIFNSWIKNSRCGWETSLTSGRIIIFMCIETNS